MTLIIIAASFFLAMFLMRWTLRASRRGRPEGVRWRGIDWSGVKLPDRTEEEKKEEPRET